MSDSSAHYEMIPLAYPSQEREGQSWRSRFVVSSPCNSFWDSFNQSQELHARCAFSPKDPAHDRGRHPSWGANTARCHTVMFPFEHHRHIHRPGKAREFREPQNLFVGNVANGDLTPEGQEMVFAERGDPQTGHTDQLVGGHRGKRRLGGARIILYKFEPGLSPTTWRLK